jgi:AraC-like DNA-binding protein
VSGEQNCEPNHYWGPGVRTTYLIHYVVSGKGVYYVGTKKFSLKKGQMFVIFPGTIIKYQADEIDPWHYAWVSFTGEEVKKIFESLSIDVFNPVFTPKNGNKLYELIKKMPCNRSLVLKDELLFTGLLYEFMSAICLPKEKVEKEQNTYFLEAKNYIDTHYFENITISSIAETVGISRKYLFAIFKLEISQSPQNYLINYRIEKACELLKDKKISIANVSFSVGYKDQFVFSKVFKQKMGISPSQWRNCF